MPRMKIGLTTKFVAWLAGLEEQDIDKAILNEIKDGKEFFMSDLVRRLNRKYPNLNANQPKVTERVEWMSQLAFKFVDVYEKDFKKYVRITKEGYDMYVWLQQKQKEMRTDWEKRFGGRREKSTGS